MIPETHSTFVSRCRVTLSLLTIFAFGACTEPASKLDANDNSVVISVLGTNDVHGALIAHPGRGGLATFSGYVTALRDARANDGGAVLLIDAGDMWQGTLESNLSEGASVVAAYNALGYTAAAVGNHEFDFGPAGPMPIPENDTDDPQGSLKRRATEAGFPLLAANLIDETTGLPVAWPNVQPSTMVEVEGVKVGIIGVMTKNALITTIAANTVGLRTAPLAQTIVDEAQKLRASGATLIIVTAHAGGRCENFDNPLDLSSCDLTGEIMQVANELPPGLVDHIFAGHAHRGIAHVVNGVSIVSSYSNARFFGRVDFTLNRATHIIQDREIFPPQRICAFVVDNGNECASAEDEATSAVVARYENRPIVPNEAVISIAEQVAAQVEKKKAQKLGVYLDTAITLDGEPETALGHLMVKAMLESNDADVSLHNVSGGIRANLPEGDLTYGSVFKMFPFDNRVVVLDLSGAELRQVLAHQVPRHQRRAGISGMHVLITCDSDTMNVRMTLDDGRDILDEDRVKVVVNDFLVFGGDGLLTPIMPDGGFTFSADLPMVRDVLVTWFSNQDGPLRADQFLGPANRRWNIPQPIPTTCTLQNP
ncbi:MAG: bifunctional metallophosphatase/5'-nucleotidase [Gammaproteobacteria bacterium]|nr:bifunctional metallophosphatase/5'-nucleotidase [Gammaproteobacteria bacterium]